MRAGPSPTPFDAMLPGINDLFDFVTDSVQASDIARVGIITFADSARVHFPLARISASYTLPRLPTNGSETNFAAVFELLGKTMKADIANLEREFGLVKRPTVFFITDGYPQQGGKRQELAQWGEALKSVHAITTRRDLGSVGTAVIAFGFGDADCENLKRIAKAPGRALRAEIGVARTSELMTEILQSIMESIQASVRRGDDLVFNLPIGMKPCV
jgi:uncharacterized protein YegL